MRLRLLGSGLVFIGFLAFFGCTLKTVETMEAGSRDSLKGKVLIATQKSQFKRTLVSEVQNNLGDHVFYVKIMNINLIWMIFSNQNTLSMHR